MLVDEVENGTRARGDYALLEVMGDPGSEVFRARTRSGRSVVLRFWRGESEVETNSAIELLENAIRVQHPMLARVHRCERFADGSLRVVSEYVAGRSLDAWVGELGLPPLSISVDFVRRLALGLVDAHRLGVTHHALYPGNIVVLEPETHAHGRIAAKLLDLGIARHMRESTRFEAAHFIAPEALAHELESPARAPHVDACMNVYSCGSLLHYLATGQPPYQSDSLVSLSALHASGRPARPVRLNPKIPAELERIICQALALDPRQRTPDMASLARALSHLESEWRSSSVRRRAEPPPLPARESVVPPPPAAAGPRLAPAIAAALALRPVPRRISEPPAPPPAAGAGAPPPQIISLDASEVALLAADEPSPIAIPAATEAIVLEPAAAPESAEVITAVLNDAEALAREMTAEAQALEQPAHAADAFEAITAQSNLAPAASASPAVASAESPPPEAASVAEEVEAAPLAMSTELPPQDLASVIAAAEPSAPASVVADVAPEVAEPAPEAVVTAEAVPGAVVTLPVVACPGEDAFARAVEEAAANAAPPVASARETPDESTPPDERSVVTSEILLLRNTLTPVEVSARRRSDMPPRRLVTDVVMVPRVAAVPRARPWRWGAAAAAGAAVYWLLMTLSSAPESPRQAIALPPTIVATAPQPKVTVHARPPVEAPVASTVTPIEEPAIPSAEILRESRRRVPQPSAARPERPEQPQPVRHESPADPLDSLHVELPGKPFEPVISGTASRVVRLEPVWSTPNVVAFSDAAQPRPSAAPESGPGSVRTASIEVQGSLSVAQARRAIERLSPQLHQCYVDSGSTGPARLQVELIIDDVGRVRNLQVRGAVPGLTECVVQVSRKLMSGLPYTGAAKVAWNLSFE